MSHGMLGPQEMSFVQFLASTTGHRLQGKVAQHGVRCLVWLVPMIKGFQAQAAELIITACKDLLSQQPGQMSNSVPLLTRQAKQQNWNLLP